MKRIFENERATSCGHRLTEENNKKFLSIMCQQNVYNAFQSFEGILLNGFSFNPQFFNLFMEIFYKIMCAREIWN